MNSFSQKIYFELKKVPKGKVTTYSELGKAVGSKAYRAIGNSLNKNPYAPIVPCHRVVCRDGKVGGFAFGVDKKIKILEAEGVMVKNGKVVDFKKKLWKF